MILFGYPIYCAINTFEVGTRVHLQEGVSSYGALCKVHRVSPDNAEVEFWPGVTAIVPLDRPARFMTTTEIDRFTAETHE